MPHQFHRLSAALNNANIGVWDWDVTTNTVQYSLAWKRQIGYADHEIGTAFEEWIDRLHPDDRPAAMQKMEAFVANPQGRYDNEFRLRHKNGSYVWIRSQGAPEFNSDGALTHLLGTHVDITSHKQAETLLNTQIRILEEIAAGASLELVLSTITACCEAEAPGMKASILLLNDNGTHIRHGAAPNLPAEYWKQIDGEPIGPQAGSCGTAAYRGEAVIVADIATDPLWTDYRDLALSHGLRACWSTPIFDSNQRVLGTFAMYYAHAGQPPLSDVRLVEMATSCASIAIVRHRNERLLHRSEQRYLRLVDANIIGVLIAKTDGSISEANDRFLDMIGASRADLEAGVVRWNDITPPEWRLVDEEIIAALQSSGISMPVEKEYVHRDGHRIPVLVSVALLDDTSMDSLCLIVDLSEQKQAQRDRAMVLERVTDAYYALDDTWHFTVLNDQAATLLGRPVDELLHANVWTEFPEAVGGTFYAGFQNALTNQVHVHIEEYYPPLKKWLDVDVYPSQDGLSVFFRDVSKRKEAEAALQLSEERFRVLVEQGGDVSFLLDRDGRFTYVSPSVFAMLGYHPGDLIGETVFDLKHPDDVPKMKASFSSKMETAGKGSRQTFRVRHRDGSWRDIEAYGVSTTVGQAGAALVGIWHDVTDRKRADALLRDSETQMRQLSQHLQEAREDEQTHIAREIHDRIGQPLTMLKLGLVRLLSKLPSNAAELQDHGAAVMADLNESIQASREIAMEIRPPVLDDLGLSAGLEWAGQRFTDRTGIPCVLDLQVENAPPEVARALYAIAQEAFTNIVRHAEATRVTVSLQQRDGMLELDVTDNGLGFDVSATGKTRSLGLVGTRERARALGGLCGVRSAPGVGTTVYAHIPWRPESVERV